MDRVIFLLGIQYILFYFIQLIFSSNFVEKEKEKSEGTKMKLVRVCATKTFYGCN